MDQSVGGRARRALVEGARLLPWLAAIYVLGRVAVHFRPPGSPIALWWPAVGLATVWLLVSPPRRRPFLAVLVLLVSTASNLATGRTLGLALVFGTLNALEASLVVAILSRGRDDARRLTSLLDLRRLLLAIVAGASLAGVVAGVIAVVQEGAPLVTGPALFASHGSALLLLVPTVLRGGPAHAPLRGLPRVLQWGLALSVTGAVFAPDQHRPIVFLVLLPPLWLALHGTVRGVASQVLAIASLAFGLTLADGGPFAALGPAVSSSRVTAVLLQVLVVVLSLVALVVAIVASERQSALEALGHREELYRIGFRASLLGALLLRREQDGLRVVEANAVAAQLHGCDRRDLVGRLWCDELEPEDRDRLRAGLAGQQTDGEAVGWRGEVRLRGAEPVRWLEVAIAPAVNTANAGDLLTAQMVDVSERRAAQQRLSDLALRDPLTGLANRTLLEDRMALALADARRTDRSVGIVFADLDGFKPVNDEHGHAVGDLLLQHIAAQLTAGVRDGDTVARLGGDEFVVLCPALTSQRELDDIADRVRAAVSTPLDLGGLELRVGASTGCAFGSGDADPRDLLRIADAAMYAAKRTAYVPRGIAPPPEVAHATAG
jgi:diguanylate cyclase (GGDEF)-like protein/PAS domain S-box-containing protein